MSIGKKLYLSFGAVLAMVVVLLLVNMAVVRREHQAKAAAANSLSMAEATDAVRFQMMQNRLFLGNYLLSGDTREVERMYDGVSKLQDLLRNAKARSNSEQQRTALERVQQAERSWAEDFSAP